MADKKIIDLLAIGTQSSTDLSETSLSGIGSRKETRVQKDTYTKNFISAKQIAVLTTSATITGTQIVNGIIRLNPADGSQSYTFPTKASLYSAMGSPPVNTSVSCQFPNISNFIATLVNSDLTITSMPTLVIPKQSTFDLIFTVTQVTPSVVINVSGGFVDNIGTGDVVGPSSATANALARYNGTTGKLIKNSTATLDDSGDLTVNSINTGNAIITGIQTNILDVSTPIIPGTISAAILVGGIVQLNPLGSEELETFDDAANILALLPNPSAFVSFQVKLVNISPSISLRLAPGSNTLFTGMPLLIQPQQTLDITCIFTDIVTPVMVCYGGTDSAIVPIVPVPDLTKTLDLSDEGSYQVCSNAGGCVVTIPTNASAAFPLGTTITFEQNAAGQVSIVPFSGSVTITSSVGALPKTIAQYNVLSITKRDTNTWNVYGGITS